MHWELTATFVKSVYPSKTKFRPVISIKNITNKGLVTKQNCYIPMVVDKQREAVQIAEERLSKIIRVIVTGEI